MTTIHCDNEFQPVMDEVALEYHIHMNYANPQEHVPEASYQKEGESRVSSKLNFFPARHGVSRYYSPRMILHQETINYHKHCQYTFGTYVQAHDEPPNPTNINQP